MLVTGLLMAAILAVGAWGSGCAASSPRFRSAGGGDDSGEDEVRFATKIREEVKKEDDRKVDIQATTRRLTARAEHPTKYSNQTPEGINRDRVLLDIVSFLGAPYEYGGMTKEGMDCSGFTMRVYRDATEAKLPRSTVQQYHAGTPVEKDSLEFGDLVFFNTTGRAPSHVGIYIEDDIFAHASVTSGVTLSSLESSYYRNRFVGARRVVQEE